MKFPAAMSCFSSGYSLPRTTVCTAATLFAFAAGAQAALRTSTSYSIITETSDAGGLAATSANYASLGSVGGLSGVSSVTTPDATVKAGYIAQLSAATGFQITAVSGTINEGSTRQLVAELLMDDDSILAVPAGDVAWSVLGGPLTGINSNGVATAGIVFQNTLATVRGVYAGDTGTLGLTVLDTNTDNFGAYASDGISDAWQIQYFGQNNPAAAPMLDPDGDGQNNLFEYTAGLVPTDRASHFTVNIAIPPGQPAQRSILFTPRLAGRTYTVKTSSNLSSWSDVVAPVVSDNGTERTVTDLTASGPRQFYRVEITLP
jgi:hypothetical protein